MRRGHEAEVTKGAKARPVQRIISPDAARLERAMKEQETIAPGQSADAGGLALSGASVAVFQADNVVLTQVVADLDFDDFQRPVCTVL